MAISAFISGHRRLLAALTASALVVLLFAPAHALAVGSGSIKLNGASVSPAQGTTATTFTFRVTYTNKGTATPPQIRVVIAGSSRVMTQANPADTNYADGATFVYRTRAVAGTHRYEFQATDSRGRVATLRGGFVRVGPAPTGGGSTTPSSGTGSGGSSSSGGSISGGSSPPRGSTGAGTSGRGSTSPGSPQRGTAGGSAARATPIAGTAQTNAPGVGSAAAGAVGALVGSGVIAPVVIDGAPWPAEAVIGALTAGGTAVEYPGASKAWGVGTSGGIGAPATTGLDFFDAPLPGYGSSEYARTLAQTLAISTSTSVLLAFSMLFFARRRREQEQERAREIDTRPEPVFDEQKLATYLYGPQQAAVLAAEQTLPRWRRPTLMAARSSGREGVANVMAAQRLKFDRGVLAVAGEREFRKIRYRMVRLCDQPDELFGNELGRLDEGDEVEIVERRGFYVRIRTPYGMEGWIHRTTIGVEVSAEDDRSESNGAPAVYTGESLVARLVRERQAV